MTGALATGDACGVILMLSRDALGALVREAVAAGVEQAMDKMDRARAAEVMTKKELAAHLGKSERTIENWLKKGLPTFWVGNERRFRRGQVEAWVADPGNVHGRRVGGLGDG